VAAEHRTNSIYIQESLTSEDGVPVSEQPLKLNIDDNTVTTVETAEDGSYETLVAVPADPGMRISVEAVYAEDSTNLSNATATTNVWMGQRSVIDRIVDWFGSELIKPALDTFLWLPISLLAISGLGTYYLLDQWDRSDFQTGIGSNCN
jgi:hypothetical protein